LADLFRYFGIFDGYFWQEDGGGIVRLGALECLGSITKAHDWSREGESLLYRLATSRRQRLVRLLLRLLLEYGGGGGGGGGSSRAVSSKAEVRNFD